MSDDAPGSVAILINSLAFGGAEKQALFVARSLRDEGFRVSVVALMDEEPERDSDGIDVRRVSWTRESGALSLFRESLTVMRKLDPDLMISFNFPSNLLGRLLGVFLSGTRLITSIRNENLGSRWRHWMVRRLEFACDCCVVNANPVGDRLRADGTISSRARVETIRNYVDCGEIRKNAGSTTGVEEDLGIPEGALGFLAPGSLKPKKNFCGLVRAWREAVHEIDAFLFIVGEGKQRREIEELVERLEVGGSVRILGLRRDLLAIMERIDVVVLPSLWEGSPNVIQEAMALEKPVVASDVGGVSELVVDGESGFTVTPGEESELAEALVRAGRLEPSEREAMGRSGGVRIASICDPGIVRQQWVDLVKELLSTSKARKS